MKTLKKIHFFIAVLNYVDDFGDLLHIIDLPFAFTMKMKVRTGLDFVLRTLYAIE